MWTLSILSFLPESFIHWVIHLVVGIGIIAIIAGFLLGFIPFINKYKLPIQIIGILVLILGIFFEGVSANEDSWQSKVKELEAKVAIAEAKSAKQNVKIVEKIVKDTQIIREKVAERVKYIDRELVKYDSSCTIPEQVINILNSAAKNTPIVQDK